MSRPKVTDNIHINSVTVCDIYCDSCGQQEQCYLPVDEAVKKYLSEGWKVISGKTTCPHCSYLKSEQ